MAMGVPMKGTKRISPARMPHSTGLGRPMAQSTAEITTAVARVQRDLGEEEARQAVGRVVHRRHRAVQVARAGEADQRGRAGLRGTAGRGC